MTDEQIMALAARYSAYADTTPTLRGNDILAFARELLDESQREPDAKWLAFFQSVIADARDLVRKRR